MSWSKQQLAAIETRGKNLLVAAAAGSGKTSVLVERIINRILEVQEEPIDIDKMLVVTFTNAAAAEMRPRQARQHWPARDALAGAVGARRIKKAGILRQKC